jgi:hypothetical protein
VFAGFLDMKMINRGKGTKHTYRKALLNEKKIKEWQ